MKYILPSFSWDKDQLNLYFQAVKSQNDLVAYCWTTQDNLPAYTALEKKRKKAWKDKWRFEPFKIHQAQKLPKNEVFSMEHGCSKYALHATFMATHWHNIIMLDFNSKLNLWAVVMHDPIYNLYKHIAQKRTIIGQIPMSEFVQRGILI